MSETGRWNVAGAQRQANAWKFNIDSIFTNDRRWCRIRKISGGERDRGDGIIVERGDVRSSDIRLEFSGKRERLILMSGRH